MKQTILLLILGGFSLTGYATPLANSDNSEFYYRIGGARSISVAPNVAVQTYALDGSLEYGLGYSCGNFDPTLGLSNLLNDLEGAGNSLINGAIGAVTAAIGSLPALILQRIDPGLYDLFQNALIRVEAVLALANQTCEQYEQQIRQGENPFEGWTDLSKMIDWKVQMGASGFGSSSVDVVQAKRNVLTANGANGIPWIGGGKAGGKGQPPIKTTEDVVTAGYNITMNRAVDDVSNPNDEDSRLVEVFESPKAASDWAVDVVGDVHIRTYDNRPVETIPGHGLLPKIEKEMKDAEDALSALVSGSVQPTLAKLAEVSSDALLITRDVIEAVRSLKPSERALAISKLASEAAMAKILEKALIIRRLLITGSREPNVQETKGYEATRESIAQLDRSIENVLFERKIYNELTSQTASVILELTAQHDNRGRSQRQAAGSEDKIMEQGALPK